MKNMLAAVFLVAFLVSGSVATADTIVDTGPGPAAGVARLYAGQWLAAEFSLSVASTITDVQGWIGCTPDPRLPCGDGTATAVIYTDGGEVPGTQLFAGAFNGDVAFDFDGPSGLSWLLTPGTYWVAFEVQAGQTLDNSMGVPSSAPLGNEAFRQPVFNGGAYSELDSIDIGVRIFGDPVTAVPEPSTGILVGTMGLIGLGGVLWRRSRRR
jgi:hypothetical protein